ncbi:SDR family oxidoreductase [Coralloluteibacterium thermophilus]|uniref:SDR family oxidoreductase n=1 Tax=Coralloluteibacterium thermophilum TaxID=2707049 RepID=A0ABV9NEF7_9GAMM
MRETTPGWLVFGATGAVGGRVLARLRGQAAPVLAVSRRPQGGDPAVDFLQGDVFADTGALADALAARGCPGTIVSAGPLDGFVAWALRSPLPPGLRMAALSSMSAETKREAEDPAERALAARLQAAERALLDAAPARGWQVTLLRPTLIWGAGLDRSLSPLVRLGARTRLLPVPRGSGGLRQPVHVDDLAQALLRAVELPELAGEVLRLPGGETLGLDEMLRRSLAAAAPQARILRVPDLLSRPVERLLALGPPRARAAANALRRSRRDLLAGGDDWTRLGIRPRPFRPGPDAFRPGV